MALPLIGLGLAGAGALGSIAGSFYESEQERAQRQAREQMQRLAQAGMPGVDTSGPFREAQVGQLGMLQAQAAGTQQTAAERAARMAASQQMGQLTGAASGMRGGQGALAMLGAQRQAGLLGQQGQLAAAQAAEQAQARASGQLSQLAGMGRSGDLSTQQLGLQHRGQQLGALGQLQQMPVTDDPFQQFGQSFLGMAPGMIGAGV